MAAPQLTDDLRVWRLVGLVATVVIVLTIPASVLLQPSATDSGPGGAAVFVGRERCVSCHAAASEAWRGSDHDLAMDAATADTVLGDFDDSVFTHRGTSSRFFRTADGFFVETEGPKGTVETFEITHTFGHEPLQQYLIPFPGGRMQALSIAWDSEQDQWFHLYPDREIPSDDWLHWTRGGQNWNGMCAECHSTNLIKGYDASNSTFETTWSEINVSCEACHGPGSRHVEWAEMPPMARPQLDDVGLVIRTSQMTSRELVELCAPCHSRRSELGDYDHSRIDLLDNILPSLLREGLYHADGQIFDEVYVWGSFVQSKMYRNDVRCSDCHDVHSLKLHHEGNALCLQCHRADTYDTADHHFHKKVHEGLPSPGALCVKCHMPEQPYMVVDWRADHSLRVPRPDLTRAIGTPNACSQPGCHPERPLSWLIDATERWYGTAKRHHYGETLAAGRAERPEARDDLVRLAGDTLYPTLVRATALSLLAAYPGEATLEAIRRGLADGEALMRFTALQLLGAFDITGLEEEIAPLLDDPVKAVRLEAVARLVGTPTDRLEDYQQLRLANQLDEYFETMEYSLDFAFAGHNLGNLSARLGELEDAEHYYRAALAIDDLFYPAKANLAVLLSGSGRFEEAETLLREILEAYPDRHDTAYSLGLLLAEMGRMEEAAEALQRAVNGQPLAARARYNLGLVLQELDRLDQAATSLERAVELDPSRPEYLHVLVDHWARRGDAARALALAEVLVDRHPGYAPGPELRAYLSRLSAAQSDR